MKKEGITMYSTYGESKSMIVERFIRTLKDIATKYFTEHSTRDWVNNLPKFMHTYNHKKHSKIKMSPVEASNTKNLTKVNDQFDEIDHEYKPPEFLIGDKVRISRIKDKFEKGYENNWSYEVFTITDILPSHPITYKIKDYFNDPIEGSFYEQELLKTEVPEYYEVEKVLKTRKVGKTKEHHVKFVGWSAWIPDNQIYDLK